MRARRIYLASSWRNPYQGEVLEALRAAGHDVYDFKHPAPGNTGFSWSEISRDWLNWTPEEFAQQLKSHPVAARGFAHDKAALDWCDTCILALPCGRSAHLELGYAAGQGKQTYVLLHEDKFEPELMYLLNTACSTSIDEIIEWMARAEPIDIMRWHRENRGHGMRTASHALRLLREMIELCVATGASGDEIRIAVDTEISKAKSRGELGVMAPRDEIAEEWADCAILLEVLRHYVYIDGHAEIAKKVAVLWQREWEADENGVLWRPETRMAA